MATKPPLRELMDGRLLDALLERSRDLTPVPGSGPCRPGRTLGSSRYPLTALAVPPADPARRMVNMGQLTDVCHQLALQHGRGQQPQSASPRRPDLGGNS